jgi:hypothetical protein
VRDPRSQCLTPHHPIERTCGRPFLGRISGLGEVVDIRHPRQTMAISFDAGQRITASNLLTECFGRRVRGPSRSNLWTSLFSDYPLWRFQQALHRPKRYTPGRLRALWLRLHSSGSALRLCRSSVGDTEWVRAPDLHTTTLHTDPRLPSTTSGTRLLHSAVSSGFAPDL